MQLSSNFPSGCAAIAMELNALCEVVDRLFKLFYDVRYYFKVGVERAMPFANDFPDSSNDIYGRLVNTI